MPFDVNKFMNTHSQPRTAEVKVPELKFFFDKGDSTVWVVRHLTADEIFKAKMRQDGLETAAAVAAAAASTKTKERTEAIKATLGVDDDLSSEIKEKMWHLVFGAVAPQIDIMHAAKMQADQPMPFILLTTRILELTGLGAVVGKPASSTTRRK